MPGDDWAHGGWVGLTWPFGAASWATIGQDLPSREATCAATDTVTVAVGDPEASHPALVTRKEHCALAAPLLAEIGSAVGRQVRIARGKSEFAIFTVAESLDGDARPPVMVGKLGRGRLGLVEPFSGRLAANLPHSELTDEEAERRGELVERLDDDGRNTGLLILAPHGGQLEPPTDLQAERVAQQIGSPRVSTWRCRGYASPDGTSAFERWHITSTDLSAASFPLLGRLTTRRFAHAVSFHGMVEDRILVGGSGPVQLKVEVRDAIREALAATTIRVDVALPGDANGGSDPRNVVNRYVAAGGIQVEQSLRARRDHWKEIADAVAQVYGSRL